MNMLYSVAFKHSICLLYKQLTVVTKVEGSAMVIYRVIQEELPPLMELISEDILSKKCHIILGPILSIYRVTFVIGNALLRTAPAAGK
jgi:hypothetical protein